MKNSELPFDKASARNRGGIIQKIITKYKLRNFNKYGKNNVIKKSAEFWLTDNAYLEIGSNCTIQDYSFFQLTKPHPRVIIGNNVTIGRHNMITAKDHLTIGDDTIIGAYVQIIDHNHNFGGGTLIREQLAEIKRVSIGKDCWIGAGVKILCGARIGNGCVIGANAVVIGEIPDNAIAVGVPAHVIGYRE